ncbi:hypothetical protein ACGFY9_40450 [Streptomyces sp. NPDC048504]|uniref:hypothetical protein n=1 Tax=Streptomyces sp. NPDC048504 TaxID=3365559 RepID=UPI00372156EB
MSDARVGTTATPGVVILEYASTGTARIRLGGPHRRPPAVCACASGVVGALFPKSATIS